MPGVRYAKRLIPESPRKPRRAVLLYACLVIPGSGLGALSFLDEPGFIAVLVLLLVLGCAGLTIALELNIRYWVRPKNVSRMYLSAAVFAANIVGSSLFAGIPAVDLWGWDMDAFVGILLGWILVFALHGIAIFSGFLSDRFYLGFRRFRRPDLTVTARPAECRRCGYSLTGLPERRCPECGKPFAAKGDTP